MLVSSQILWLSSLPSKQLFWGSILWRSDLISWKPVAVVVQWPSYVWLFVTPWTAASQASLSLTISQSLPKFMFIASVMSFSHLILWHPPFLLPSVFPNIGVFSTESGISIRWPKYWRASVLPVSIQGWFSLRLTSLISLLSKWPSRVFSRTTVGRHEFFGALLRSIGRREA